MQWDDSSWEGLCCPLYGGGQCQLIVGCQEWFQNLDFFTKGYKRELLETPYNFFMKTEFHVSGPGAECIGILSIALMKSSGVNSMSVMLGSCKSPPKKNSSGFSILNSVFGLLKTDSCCLLSISHISSSLMV